MYKSNSEDGFINDCFFSYITLYIISTQLCQSLQDIFIILYDFKHIYFIYWLLILCWTQNSKITLLYTVLWDIIIRKSLYVLWYTKYNETVMAISPSSCVLQILRWPSLLQAVCSKYCDGHLSVKLCAPNTAMAISPSSCVLLI